VRVYSLGLPAEVRERRLQQVESDAWEQEADSLRGGLGPVRTGFDIFERTLRGVPADILWRFQLEGPKMQLHIPFQRITGIALLLLIVLLPASSSISGVDTGREEWASTLLDFGDTPEWQAKANVLFWTVAGMALIAIAAAFYLALQKTSPNLATMAAFLLAAAGLLVIVSAALYRSFAALAQEYADHGQQAELLASSRSLALAVEALQLGIIGLMGTGVLTLALAAHRHRLVAPWLGRVAAVAAVMLVGYLVTSVIEPLGDSASWGLGMGAMLILMFWLIAAGILLVINRKPLPPTEMAPAPAPI
jgi:hypothetical protein